MRAFTILLTTSLLLAALATPAQADPLNALPPVPVAPLHDDCDGEFHTDGFILVVQRTDCTYGVFVGNGLTCAPPSSTTVHRDVGGHDVSVSVCDGGIGDMIAPVGIASAASCPAKTYDNGQQRVEIQRDCDVYVKPVGCITGGVYDERASAGPITVYTYRCTFGPPPAQGTDSPVPELPSLREEACQLMMGNDNCGAPRSDRPIYVDLPKTYDCVWGGSWVTVYQVGPVHVREYRCTEPVESRAADPFPTCVTEPCGPSVPGIPLVGSSCESFHVDGTVTYYQYSNCGARVTALGQEFCYDGAGCQDPCGLPDVGRTGAGLFWDDDCTADPHLDTSGSCLGGGGRDVRVFQRGNVNIVVTVCDGPDPTVTGTDAPPCNGPFYTERTVGPVTVYFGGGLNCSGVRLDDGDAPTTVEELREMFCRQMMGQDDCSGAPP